jgi:hypothetical protein
MKRGPAIVRALSQISIISRRGAKSGTGLSNVTCDRVGQDGCADGCRQRVHPAFLFLRICNFAFISAASSIPDKRLTLPLPFIIV